MTSWSIRRARDSARSSDASSSRGVEFGDWRTYAHYRPHASRCLRCSGLRAGSGVAPHLDFTVRTGVECRPSDMAHPKDGHALTRRRLLQGAAGVTLGAGALGALTGCENTTTPTGTGAGPVQSRFVEAKPIGPGGLPLPRPDNAVTWAITADNKPILDGRPV